MTQIRHLFNGRREFDKMFELKRWNGHKTVQKENVAEHSYFVASFVAILLSELGFDKSPMDAYKVIQYALFHDLDEVFTGDINHNVKHSTSQGVVIKKYLEEYIAQANTVFPSWMLYGGENLPDWGKPLVKCVDWLSMFWYCLRERELGNQTIDEVGVYCCEQYIKSVQYLYNIVSNAKKNRYREVFVEWIEVVKEKMPIFFCPIDKYNTILQTKIQ